MNFFDRMLFIVNKVFLKGLREIICLKCFIYNMYLINVNFFVLGLFLVF